ncbi:hypothetical protein OXYTRIMIC_519 [Oxytricha trifallax]|uniref:Uncharacterized protein n=1 Tax=Oxytricha trifallax TaxID=1172189 RepID=A0A073HWP8_9SPIT|nr:hypothetical protein OXYTRIMIC_519 [Oxytricha trifallax]
MKICELLNQAGDPTRFSKLLNENILFDLESHKQIEVITNMIWLDQRIRKLEVREYYQPIKKLFRMIYVKKRGADFDEKVLNDLTSNMNIQMQEYQEVYNKRESESYNQLILISDSGSFELLYFLVITLSIYFAFQLPKVFYYYYQNLINTGFKSSL